MQGDRVGLADNWLRHLEAVREKHHDRAAATTTPDERVDRLCECNLIEPVANVALDAWARGQQLAVHRWIYGLGDGLVRDLGVNVDHAVGA